jgi:hypothetical protein
MGEHSLIQLQEKGTPIDAKNNSQLSRKERLYMCQLILTMLYNIPAAVAAAEADATAAATSISKCVITSLSNGARIKVGGGKDLKTRI